MTGRYAKELKKLKVSRCKKHIVRLSPLTPYSLQPPSKHWRLLLWRVSQQSIIGVKDSYIITKHTKYQQ